MQKEEEYEKDVKRSNFKLGQWAFSNFLVQLLHL